MNDLRGLRKAIYELLKTGGPKSFSQIYHGVQAIDQFTGLEDPHTHVKENLAYLIKQRLVIESNDEYGIVYECSNCRRLTNKIIRESAQKLFNRNLSHGDLLNIAMWNDLLSYLLWLGVDRDDLQKYADDLNLRTIQAHPNCTSKIELETLDSRLKTLEILARIPMDMTTSIQRLCDELESLTIDDDELTAIAQSIYKQLWAAGFDKPQTNAATLVPALNRY